MAARARHGAGWDVQPESFVAADAVSGLVHELRGLLWDVVSVHLGRESAEATEWGDLPVESVRLAEVRDGTSQTIGFGEHAHSKVKNPIEALVWHWWTSGDYGDTVFTSLYPINPERLMPDVSADGLARAYVSAASSMHPGGANFAFLDGSVHYLKDTIESWPSDPNSGMPRGWGRPGGFFTPGANSRLGVYQALTTRAGREVIDTGIVEP